LKKYPETPVITFQKHPTEKGKNFKIYFNKYALEFTGLVPGEDEIAFGFRPADEHHETNDLFIARAGSDVPDNHKVALGKNATISHKRYSEYTYKFLGLSPELDYEFELHPYSDTPDGQTVYLLGLLSETSEEAVVEETTTTEEPVEASDDSILGMVINTELPA
jgi:hypothetical protein